MFCLHLFQDFSELIENFPSEILIKSSAEALGTIRKEIVYGLERNTFRLAEQLDCELKTEKKMSTVKFH